MHNSTPTREQDTHECAPNKLKRAHKDTLKGTRTIGAHPVGRVRFEVAVVRVRLDARDEVDDGLAPPVAHEKVGRLAAASHQLDERALARLRRLEDDVRVDRLSAEEMDTGLRSSHRAIL